MKRLLVLPVSLLLGMARTVLADSSVTFNEIMYHPAINEPALEWVELRNQMAVDVDISNWSISGGIQYTFASNSIVPGGGHLVVSIAPEILKTNAGINNVVGPFTGRLSNNGDTLRLRNNSGRVVDEVSYGVEGDWPVGPDGSGVSLAKRDPEAASGPASSWTVSEQIGGTPGTANFKVTGAFLAPPGLVSYWNFNEPSGAVALDLAGQNQGAVGSAVTHTISPAVGGALSFNGTSNAYVNAGPGVGNNFSVGSALTIEAVLAPGWSGTNTAVIFRKAPRRPGAYSTTVLASQPLAYWRMGDTTTNITDATANNHTGAATPGVFLNEPSLIATDPSNNAVRAVGADRITIPGFEKIGAGGYSVEFWVKVNTLPAGCCQNLVGDGEGSGDYFLMNYILGTAQGQLGAIRPHFGPINSPVSLDSTSALQVNRAYHIVSTWDTSQAANNAIIYINGIADKVGTISRTVPTAGTYGNNRVYIGHDDREVGDGSYTYDEVALYNRPLSASDVAAHYTAGALVNFDVNQGNAIQLALQNDGNNAQANPPVAEGPVLSFGLTVAGVYSELDMPLDGQSGRPTLAALENGQLHHVAASYDSATGLKAIYVDGIVRASTTLSGTLNATNSANAVLGNSEVNGSAAFVGTLDELAYWGKALSPAEVSAHATAIAAGRDYFSADAQSTTISLAFNELSPSTNGMFWLELINYGSTTLPLENYAIVRDGVANGSYVFPAGVSIAAGGYLAISNNVLGFLPVAGDKLYLMPPARDRVLDAVVVKRGARARSPSAVSPWLVPTAPSPGGPNVILLHNEIVINEIMYDHQALFSTNGLPPRDSAESWIELYNRGSIAVDLTGWEITGGVSYRFTPGQILAPGAYLVVADDAAALRAIYPGIPIVGNLGGKLSHGGDQVMLTDPAGNPANAVRYFDRAPWPGYAAGGGSSLELRDPNADNSVADAWDDSDESGKTSWQTVTYKATAGSGQPTQWTDFIFGLLGSGECLIDDITVVESPTNSPVQVVANGNFENGLVGWRSIGTHVRSRVEPEAGNPGNHVLHIIATGPQEHMHNHIETTLIGNRAINASKEYQISFRARWLAGNNQLNTRLYFNRVARTTTLGVPSKTGTPGAPNSRFAGNIGPTFSGLAHSPVVPQPGQSVTVTVSAQDPQGVATAEVWWSADGGSWSSAPMTPQGGGVYSGTVPGFASGAIVQFYVRAVDGLGAISMYPAAGPDSGALYPVADGQANLSLGHNFRIVLTPANTALLHAFTNVMSNDELPMTLIYDERKAYYNLRIRLKGSERGRYSDTRTSFHLEFPSDNLFRGVHPVMLIDRSGAGDSTANKQEEIVIKHILLRAGDIPGTQPDMCRVIAPLSIHTGPAILSPRHEDEFIRTEYASGASGTMWELELIYYPTSTNQYGYKNPQPDSVVGTDIQNLGDDKELYRYNFIIKNHRDVDDYSRFIGWAKTLSLPAGTSVQQQVMEAETRQVMDTSEWTRAFALESLCGVGDSYTFGNAHNLFMYVRPSDQKFVAFPVDMDFSFNRGSSSSLIGDSTLSTVFNIPANKRLMYAHALDIIATSYNTGYMTPWVTHYAKFAPGQDYTSVIPYISQRIAAVQSEINGNGGNTAFNVTTASQVNTATNLVAISGTAPVGVHTILINGVQYPIVWNTVSGWSIKVPVSDPITVLNIQAYDLHGNLMTGLARTITINYSGTVPDPAGVVILNEIMYNPILSGAGYVEILNTSPTASYDLSGWRINGLGFTFPPGSILTNKAIITVAASSPGYVGAYGTNSPAPAGEFPGNLQNDGETLTLLRPGTLPGQELIVDRVRYEAALPWPSRPNGGGGSLQLIDASQDNSRVANWSDGSGWRLYSLTSIAGASPPPTNLIIFMSGATDVYIDNVSLVAGTAAGVGDNLLANGGFENGLGPWLAGGNHSNSTVVTGISFGGSNSLHVVATGTGSTVGNVAQAVLPQAIPPGLVTSNIYTFSFWYLPNTNGVGLRFRITSTFSTGAGSIDPRPVFATPGVANSTVGSLTPFPPIWLNEVQPENLTGPTDNFGEHDPWLEIYNAGSVTISLDGYFLSDTYANVAKWAFPAGATLQPGEFKVVYADEQPAQTSGANWHTNFRLPPGSGSVALAWSPGGNVQVLDYLNYTNITAGRSYGDYPDGQVFDRQEFYLPTPGAANNNLAPPLIVRFNEWMAANSSGLINTNNSNRYDDWAELYNPGNTPADLGGFFLSGNPANVFQFEIPAGYVIPPHGYLLVWCDNHPSANNPEDPDLHVNFKLNQAGEQIGIYASDGVLIDSVTFEPQFTDVSQGRFPDGSGPIYFLKSPTPRGPNTTWANRYPSLNPVPDAQIVTGETLAFTAVGSDPDGQALAYSLDAGAPTGAVINASSGAFTWTAPSTATTNPITIRVTDAGVPALSATRTFTVGVVAGFKVSSVSRQPNGDVALQIGATPGKTYRVEFTDDLGAASWTPIVPDQHADSTTLTILDPAVTSPHRFYRVRQLD